MSAFDLLVEAAASCQHEDVSEEAEEPAPKKSKKERKSKAHHSDSADAISVTAVAVVKRENSFDMGNGDLSKMGPGGVLGRDIGHDAVSTLERNRRRKRCQRDKTKSKLDELQALLPSKECRTLNQLIAEAIREVRKYRNKGRQLDDGWFFDAMCRLGQDVQEPYAPPAPGDVKGFTQKYGLMTSSLAGFLVLSKDWTVVNCSFGFLRLTELKRDQVVGKNISQLVDSAIDSKALSALLHRPPVWPDVPISGSLKFKGPKATPVSVEHILPQYPMPKSGNSSSNGAVRNEDNGSNGNGAGVPEGLSNLQAALGQSQAPQPSSEQLMEFQEKAPTMLLVYPPVNLASAETAQPNPALTAKSAEGEKLKDFAEMFRWLSKHPHLIRSMGKVPGEEGDPATDYVPLAYMAMGVVATEERTTWLKGDRKSVV